MQRQLYLVLFVMAAAAAVVVVMRPNVADELTTLGQLGLPGLLSQAVAEQPERAPAVSSGSYVPGNPAFSATTPVSWADAASPGGAEAAGESFVSDSAPSSRLPNAYSPAPRPPISYPHTPDRRTSAQSGPFGRGIPGQRPLGSRGLPPSPSRYQQPATTLRQNQQPSAAWMGQEPAAAPRFGSLAAPRRYEPATATEQYAEAGANRTRDRLPQATVAAPSANKSSSTYPPRETYSPTNRPFASYPSPPNVPGMTNEASVGNVVNQPPVAYPMPTQAGSPRGYQGSTGSFAPATTARSFDGVEVSNWPEVSETPKSAPTENWWEIDELRREQAARRRTAPNATARQNGVPGETFSPRDPSRTVPPEAARPWTPSQHPAAPLFSGPVRPPTPESAAPPTSGSAWPAATEPTRPQVASRFERPWQPPRREMPRVAPDPPPTALFENAQILARVGSHVILACEVLPLVNRVLEENKDKYPPSVLEEQRELLTGKLLDQRIEMKLIFCDAQRSLPPETITNIENHLSEQFEKEEIPKRLEKAELGSRLELQQELEKIGSSLEREKRSFIERAVSQQWVFQQIGEEKEITHEDILDYYRQNATDFEHTARARWEQLTVRSSRHPDRREARALLAQMGNDVMRGRPFADVAREHSEGSTAGDGGARDWTIQGSLRSEQIDRTLFGLPVGQLSPILEDEQGVHIVRVVEREDASQTPFIEAQVEIKEKLRQAHRKERLGVFTERLKKEIPVWTVFDAEVADRRSSESSELPTR